jgi:type IV pilus assembly protein PilC
VALPVLGILLWLVTNLVGTGGRGVFPTLQSKLSLGDAYREQGRFDAWYFENRLPLRPQDYAEIIRASLPESPCGTEDAGIEDGDDADRQRHLDRQLATRDERVRDKLISISIYPVIVLGIAAVVVYQLATGPLPQLGKVLEYFKGELPWQSKVTIELGKFIGAYPIFYLVAIASFIYLLMRLPAFVRATPALHQWVLKIPFVGNLILVSIRANFVQTLATLKKSKVDSLKCLVLLQGISWCYPYRAAITRGYRRVANGEGLAVALAEEADILGQRTIEYLRVLEETGADVEMLERLALVMNRDLDNAIGRAETIAKPLIILFLAGLIGIIASAVYGPLIELYNRL